MVEGGQKAKCIRLGSFDKVLQHRHVSMPIAYDIPANLHEMFCAKGITTRQVAFKAIMDTKMSKETPIRDNMIRMIGLFNKMETFGVDIDRET